MPLRFRTDAIRHAHKKGVRGDFNAFPHKLHVSDLAIHGRQKAVKTARAGDDIGGWVLFLNGHSVYGRIQKGPLLAGCRHQRQAGHQKESGGHRPGRRCQCQTTLAKTSVSTPNTAETTWHIYSVSARAGGKESLTNRKSTTHGQAIKKAPAKAYFPLGVADRNSSKEGGGCSASVVSFCRAIIQCPERSLRKWMRA